MTKSIKLINYTEENIERGMILRCKGKDPYEEVVDFLICELSSDDGYQLVVSSGYKAGLAYVILPRESVPEGFRFGLATAWLLANWHIWGYIDCPLEDVWLLENSTPAYPE
ncbi:Imm45 family immunity protein [Chitinophaga sp. MM2321]|uniref:Imm45 family immunity protein n=1 Tax=Chitinophaga sp. MM2321 TaxID=3137178 RepID=UPI0032D583FB